MIIPEYWAEARRQYRGPKKQVTVRRFGWSNDSQQAAQVHADARADEALLRAVEDPRIPRRDPKVPYNGAVGLPIREEVIDRQDRYVITRNSYGALCLNTPDVLFADIDCSPPRVFLAGAMGVCFLIGLGITMATGSSIIGVAVCAVLLVLYARWRTRVARRIAASNRLYEDELARIETRTQQFRDWSLRVYRTPAGFRLLVTNRTFDPSESEVARFFSTFGVDPIYALMCQNQNCFRARLTAKPWRIGIDQPMRPRPGVWPVAPERLAERAAWIENYQSVAKNYAACEYLKSYGSEQIHALVQPVLDIHDQLTQAATGRPMA